jgi:hypothetical protein
MYGVVMRSALAVAEVAALGSPMSTMPFSSRPAASSSSANVSSTSSYGSS